ATITGILKQTPGWKSLSNNPAYAKLKTDDQKADELFNTLLGNYGEYNPRVREIIGDDIGLFARIQHAINEFLEWLKATVFKNTDAKLNVFAKKTLNELLSGKPLKKSEKIKSFEESVKAVTDLTQTLPSNATEAEIRSALEKINPDFAKDNNLVRAVRMMVVKTDYTHKSVARAIIAEFKKRGVAEATKNSSHTTSSEYYKVVHKGVVFDFRFANHSQWIDNRADATPDSEVVFDDDTNEITHVHISTDELEPKKSDIVGFINWVEKWNSEKHENRPDFEYMLEKSKHNPLFRMTIKDELIGKISEIQSAKAESAKAELPIAKEVESIKKEIEKIQAETRKEKGEDEYNKIKSRVEELEKILPLRYGKKYLGLNYSEADAAFKKDVDEFGREKYNELEKEYNELEYSVLPKFFDTEEVLKLKDKLYKDYTIDTYGKRFNYTYGLMAMEDKYKNSIDLSFGKSDYDLFKKDVLSEILPDNNKYSELASQEDKAEKKGVLTESTEQDKENANDAFLHNLRLRMQIIGNLQSNGAQMADQANYDFDVTGITEANAQEMQGIKEAAVANGTFMKAPNGKQSNLNERQWLQVRTKAFKQWFGDWELKFKSVNIIPVSRRFKNFKEAKEWAKNNIAGIYEKEQTGGKGRIEISKKAIDKFFNESAVVKSENAEIHKSVISVLPEVIKNSVVGEIHSDYKKIDGVRKPENGIIPNTEIHRLFGAVELDGKIYRVKTTVKYFTDKSNENNVHSYEVIKIELLDETDNSTERNPDSQTVSPIAAAKLLQNVEKSYEKGKNLLDNHSKVVDENGEPLVVYHFTDEEFTTFDITKSSSYTGTPDYNIPGFYFSPYYSESSDYGENTINSYMVIKNPFYGNELWKYRNDNELKSWREVYDKLIEEGYDGVMYDEGYNEEIMEYISFVPSQIKSATANNGNFDSENNDIRFMFAGEKGIKNAAQSDNEAVRQEAETRLENLDVAKKMEARLADEADAKRQRIEKLRTSEPIEITGEEYKGKYELNPKSAKEYIKEHLRGKYTIKDTGETIKVSRVGANEVTSHGERDEAHLKSIAAIPQVIENSIFIAEEPNTKDNGKYESYRYYVSGMKIGETDYTVKMVVGKKGDSWYYDHELTQIEKQNLIDATRLPNSLDINKVEDGGFTTKGGTPDLLIPHGKDKRLISILQTNDTENAKKIKFATGWERGADGKWRYEMMDGIIKKTPLITYPYKLPDIFDNEKLYVAYPALRDMDLYFTYNMSGKGSYDKENGIEINAKLVFTEENEINETGDEFYQNEINSVIIHEIQHAIQGIEGFAVGSSPSAFKDNTTDILQAINAITGVNVYGAVNNALDKLSKRENENDYKTAPLYIYGKELNELAQQYGYADEFQMLDNLENESSIIKYHRTAGEVEARNAASRKDMTAEERRAILAEETEDVAREDQIFIYDGLGEKSMKVDESRQKSKKVPRPYVFKKWQDEERYNMHRWIVDRVKRKYKSALSNNNT
ncbi:MAG: hypothetical protein LBS55_12260, partial [Prevotellaceae bacterium]|nr:hypothetical protein [Prevotellaceae bacterium]